MKKAISMCLCFAVLLSVCGILAVPASAEGTPSVIETFYEGEDGAFFYPFDKEMSLGSRLAMMGDNQISYYKGDSNNTSGMLRIQNYNSINRGVTGVKLIPGQKIKISGEVKFLNSDKLSPKVGVRLVFIGDSTVPVYKDYACTQPLMIGEEQVTLKDKYFGVSIDKDIYGNNMVDGEWHTFEYIYEYDGTFATSKIDSVTYTNYIKDTVTSQMYFRPMGNSPLGKPAGSPSENFTQEYIDACSAAGTTPYVDCLLDNFSVMPYSGMLTDGGNVGYEPNIYNGFEDDGWKKDPNKTNFSWSNSNSNAALSENVPEALAETSKSSIELTYKGAPRDAFVDVGFSATGPAHKMWFNRAYKISLWAKGSEALAQFGAANNKPLVFIPDRSGDKRIDRTRSKWLQSPTKEIITDDWQKYEFIWYEDMEYAIGRKSDTDFTTRFTIRTYAVPVGTENNLTATTESGEAVQYIYSYQNSTGETVYAGLEDFKLYIDDVTIEPLDIVYNGDMAVKDAADNDTGVIYYKNGKKSSDYCAPGGDTISANLFHAGTIAADATFQQETGLEKKNVLKVAANETPYQSVEIDQGKTYKISFWAKAESGSENMPLYAMMDRSIKGDVLDSTVTDKNPNGLLGYGNSTGITGDIPFYLYSGTQQNVFHDYNKFEITADGETVVSDDYFARMKSVNGYESQAEPTAWNYQYFNGDSWVNTNEEAKTPGSWTLAGGWTKYECFYQWNYQGGHYRMPRLSFVSDGAYAIADIHVEEAVPYQFGIENVSVSGDKEVFEIGDELSVTYDFVSSGAQTANEGKAQVLILAGTEAEGFYPVMAGTAEGAFSFRVPSGAIGKQLKIQITPVSYDYIYAQKPFEISLTGTAKSKLSATLKSFDKSAATWQLWATYGESKPTTADIVTALYDADNRLLKTEVAKAEVKNGDDGLVASGTVFADNAVLGKVFVLDSLDTLKPICSSEKADLSGGSERDSIKVLAIGNSYAEDATNYFYQLAEDAGVKDITVAYLYIGGCTLETHVKNLEGNLPAYRYTKNNTGSWKSETEKTMLYGIVDEDWDVITLQQQSANSGIASSFEPNLTKLIDYVQQNKTNPSCEIYWHMTWAYQEGYAGLSAFGNDQMTMYERISQNVQEIVLPKEDIESIIPVGTAVQNARTSHLGDTLNRDGIHLTLDLGRYLAGLVWVKKLTNRSIDNIDYVPANYAASFGGDVLPLLKEAANKAVREPFAVTNSSFTK